MEKERAEEIINETINELELIVAGDEEEQNNKFSSWSMFVNCNDAFQGVVNHYHHSLGRDLRMALQVFNNAALATKLNGLIDAAIEEWLENAEYSNNIYLEANIENDYEFEAWAQMDTRFPTLQEIRDNGRQLRIKDELVEYEKEQEDNWDFFKKFYEDR